MQYHLTEEGPKRCNALVRTCPFGGAHFEDMPAARRAFELSLEPLKALKKEPRLVAGRPAQEIYRRPGASFRT